MDEDMILPDDFEMPPEVETVEDTTPTEETEVEAPKHRNKSHKPSNLNRLPS
jgi:hypothetical protein